MPNREVRFVDLFLMKRIEGDWKIISKTADSAPSNRTGERVLLIVSDARHHGDTDIPAGISFEEAFTAYDVFEREGYTVDFVSPNGGPVPLTYIQMSDPEHMDHIYDTDFMAKLKDTKAPDEVDPGDYRAVQFIGGSNAMYGVPENEAIQAIAMTIYEEQGGVISAVCHGTAGVTALKTKDGRYLVDGKRLTGFPEDYEKKDAAYFDAFPFLIGETVKKRGGAFSFAPKRLPHVIEDGRLITGQNPASSEALAEAVVDRLRAE
jgi:putative intracellular protease/amidase